MQIGIIGAGNVGSGLGLAWQRAGHRVHWGVRDPDDARYADLDRTSLMLPAEAAEGADAIVLATPWNATEMAVKALGNLAGRTLIDATNPLRMGSGGLELALGFTTSGAECIAEWAAGASVVKAFNQTGAENLGNAGRYAARPLMYVAGDSDKAKQTAMILAADAGFEPIDGGPLRNARLLEPMAMVWIDQAFNRGAGRDFAYTLQRPRD